MKALGDWICTIINGWIIFTLHVYLTVLYWMSRVTGDLLGRGVPRATRGSRVLQAWTSLALWYVVHDHLTLCCSSPLACCLLSEPFVHFPTFPPEFLPLMLWMCDLALADRAVTRLKVFLWRQLLQLLLLLLFLLPAPRPPVHWYSISASVLLLLLSLS